MVYDSMSVTQRPEPSKVIRVI